MTERGAARSERRRVRRAIVVGSGVAGMSAALELAKSGVPVLLVGRTPAVRSPSVCHKDGIAVALGRSSSDSPSAHFRETILAGDFAAAQPPVRALCEAAPRLVSGLDRAGVPFERTLEGQIHRDPVSAAEGPRAARAGVCTAEQVLRALDRELLRQESLDALDTRGSTVPGEPLVLRLVPWEFLGVVLDDNGVCVGIVAADLRKGLLRALPADAVCLASGGFGALWDGSTADVWADGAAIARVFAQGAVLANPEFVGWQPTAIVGVDKAHALPEVLRVLGARVFAAKDPSVGEALLEKERDYFLEKSFASARGLIWSDEAARAIWRSSRRLADSGASVLLDVAPIAARPGAGDLFEDLARSTGLDARSVPLPIVARAEASLGGLWVDYEARADASLLADSPRSHATNIPGLYAAGSAEYQYHGAGRLTGNQLTASLFAGWLAARGMNAYRQALDRSAFDLPGSVFERTESVQQSRADQRRRSQSDALENPFVVRDALGALVASACGIERNDEQLDASSTELDAIAERAELATHDAPLFDPASRLAHSLPSLVTLARAILLAARHRAECRGSHYKPELDRRVTRGVPERGPPRISLVVGGETGQPHVVDAFEYTSAGTPVRVGAEVDVSLLSPTARESAGATHEH